jgi:hypothetical protein
LATNNKDFRIKNGLIVDGANATVNGSSVLTTASSIDALNDVTITTPSSGQVLKWNGTAWINDTDATGAGGGGNVFETISANGISVVADSSTDTLTITPGSGMSIVGNATSDTVTFSVDYAEKIYYLVRNNTGSTIPKGTLVSASGAEPSGRIDVAPHETTGLQDSELRVMGMATANISNGVNGEVISFGTLTEIDTRGNTASAIAVGDETWAAGDILYAHPTVAGKLTNVRPQHDLAVAFITVRHASTGQIAVRIIPGNNHLEWLHDVAIDGTPADNELLAYNSNTATWINQTAEEAGVANLSGATFTGNVAGTNISMSGNVNANTVNATTFIGSGASLTSIPNSATTANSANGASTIVARDATGNFTANVVTATTLVGSTNAATITGTVANATTGAVANQVGFLGIPRSSKNTTSTLALADIGDHLYVTTSAQTITIPSNANVAFPIGAAITIIAAANTVSVAYEAGVTIYQASVGLIASSPMTVGLYGMGTLLKVDTNTWYISGVGVTD